MGVWRQISEYLFLRKKDPGQQYSKWTGYMHTINRIAIYLFIIGIIILVIKLLR